MAHSHWEAEQAGCGFYPCSLRAEYRCMVDLSAAGRIGKCQELISKVLLYNTHNSNVQYFPVVVRVFGTWCAESLPTDPNSTLLCFCQPSKVHIMCVYCVSSSLYFSTLVYNVNSPLASFSGKGGGVYKRPLFWFVGMSLYNVQNL